MFQQNKKSMISYGYINHQTKISENRPILQAIYALIWLFDKNEGNSREKKTFQKNVESQFVNGGLHL